MLKCELSCAQHLHLSALPPLSPILRRHSRLPPPPNSIHSHLELPTQRPFAVHTSGLLPALNLQPKAPTSSDTQTTTSTVMITARYQSPYSHRFIDVYKGEVACTEERSQSSHRRGHDRRDDKHEAEALAPIMWAWHRLFMVQEPKFLRHHYSVWSRRCPPLRRSPSRPEQQ